MMTAIRMSSRTADSPPRVIPVTAQLSPPEPLAALVATPGLQVGHVVGLGQVLPVWVMGVLPVWVVGVVSGWVVGALPVWVVGVVSGWVVGVVSGWVVGVVSGWVVGLVRVRMVDVVWVIDSEGVLTVLGFSHGVLTVVTAVLSLQGQRL